MYARNIVTEAIQKALPEVINCVTKAFDTHTKSSSGNDADATVNFEEYANPSFGATMEAVAKTRPGKVIMSVEASVDEMYGDSKDEEWKAEEIKRLRIESGVMKTQESVISEFDGLGGTISVPEDYENE